MSTLVCVKVKIEYKGVLVLILKSFRDHYCIRKAANFKLFL